MTLETKRLSETAKIFAKLFEMSTTLPLKKRSRVRQLGSPRGWYQTVAVLHPSQTSIDVFYDNSLEDNELGFWVGFTSEREHEIQQMVAGRPLDMVALDDEVAPNPLDTAIIEYPGDGYLSAFGVYFPTGEPMDQTKALNFVCDVLESNPEYRDFVRTDRTARDLMALDDDPSIEGKEKIRLARARIGQGEYRRGLEKLWDGKCSVLGVENRSALRASHVKPWAASSSSEKIDPENGLLLSAHLDALFDAYLITFTNSGEMEIAPDVSLGDQALLRLQPGRLRRQPSPKLLTYLEHHRGRFRERKAKLGPAIKT